MILRVQKHCLVLSVRLRHLPSSLDRDLSRVVIVNEKFSMVTHISQEANELEFLVPRQRLTLRRNRAQILDNKMADDKIIILSVERDEDEGDSCRSCRERLLAISTCDIVTYLHSRYL